MASLVRRMVTIPDTRDGRNQTPVFFGYSLAKRSKEMLEGQYTDHGSTRKDFVKYRPGQPCPVCLVGKPGCPCCWDFPEGYEPKDFAFAGPIKKHCDRSPRSKLSSQSGSRAGSVESLLVPCSTSRDGGDPSAANWPFSKRKAVLLKGEQAQPVKLECHTDLTTTASVKLYRQLVARVVRIFVKVIPCGAVTCLWMYDSWPVSYLYDLWRMNASEGTSKDVSMFLPTIAGQWSLDNQNLPNTDTTLGVHAGNLPISTYNLTTSRSTVTVLCTTSLIPVEKKESIERYLGYQIGVGETITASIFNHLVGCPKHPENDPVQKSLCLTMENTMRQKQIVEEDEARADRWRRNHLLVEAEKASKEAALVMKRQQVAHGSKERTAAFPHGTGGQHTCLGGSGAILRPERLNLKEDIKMANTGEYRDNGLDSPVASTRGGNCLRLDLSFAGKLPPKK